MRGFVRLIIAATVLLAMTAMPAVSAAIQFSPYEFVTRDGQRVQVERGTIAVPENRRKPDGGAIELAFVRFPALKPTGRAPIVYLAGGPGGSGVDAARMPARFAIFQALREVADVIAFDQRGTGASHPLPRCPNALNLPQDKPTTGESLTAATREVAATCAAFWREQGVDLAAYNTRESAADIDALRRELGAPKISLWGISYGSHLGLAVLKYYPKRIERASFVGIEGLDETVKLPALTDAYLGRLQAAAVATYPDFIATMRRVHARLEREPVTVTFKDPTGQETTIVMGLTDVRAAATGLTSDPARSRLLPGLYAMMDAGDFSRAAPIAWEVLRKPGAMALTGMSEAMDVASGISRERLNLFKQQAPGSLLGDIVNYPMPHVGNALGVPDMGDSFRAPFRSDVPTLFLSGTLDGRTYPESAREIIKRFRHGHQLIVENGGHNLFEASPLIKDVVVAWFRGETPTSTVLALPPPEFPR